MGFILARGGKYRLRLTLATKARISTRIKEFSARSPSVTYVRMEAYSHKDTEST